MKNTKAENETRFSKLADIPFISSFIHTHTRPPPFLCLFSTTKGGVGEIKSNKSSHNAGALSLYSFLLTTQRWILQRGGVQLSAFLVFSCTHHVYKGKTKWPAILYSSFMFFSRITQKSCTWYVQYICCREWWIRLWFEMLGRGIIGQSYRGFQWIV